MNNFTYVKAERVWLKSHADFTEKWLQDRIAEEPGILGLGSDVVLIDRERRQFSAGRLDLLVADPDQNRRYEVELQLGPTDETHIIRCIEYWDVERRRYPAYDHCAVIVAEDITSRFLNVLSLFSGNIPLIALQLSALAIGNQIALNFARVLDFTALREDDEDEGKLAAADRAYWNDRASPQTVALADEFLEMINQKSDEKFELNYNKYYIGLTNGTRSRNFLHFRPKKKFTHLMADVSERDAWLERLEEAGFATTTHGDRFLRVTVSPKEIEKHRALLAELVHKALEEYQGAPGLAT